MDFPNILQQHLDRLQWSRADILNALADAGHPRSRATISMWMGKVRPDPQILPILCEVLALDSHQAAALYEAAGVPLPSVLRPTQVAA